MKNSFSINFSNKGFIVFGSIKFVVVLTLFSFSIVTNFYEELSFAFSEYNLNALWLKEIVEYSKSFYGVIVVYLIPIVIVLSLNKVSSHFLNLFGKLKKHSNNDAKRISVATIKIESPTLPSIKKGMVFFKGLKKNMVRGTKIHENITGIKYGQYIENPYR